MTLQPQSRRSDKEDTDFGRSLGRIWFSVADIYYTAHHQLQMSRENGRLIPLPPAGRRRSFSSPHCCSFPRFTPLRACVGWPIAVVVRFHNRSTFGAACCSRSSNEVTYLGGVRDRRTKYVRNPAHQVLPLLSVPHNATRGRGSLKQCPRLLISH